MLKTFKSNAEVIFIN